ncbi:MAG: hypothetical protein AAFR33_14530 [Pseudomonadota bacterium]
MDTRDYYALELGWRLVGMTLTALTALPGLATGFLCSRDWARAFRELRHAEQVARRLIIAEAGRLIAAGEIAVKPHAPSSADTCEGRYPGPKDDAGHALQSAQTPVHGPLPSQGSAE